MLKKAIIFDLDGTILDTLTDLTNAVNETLKQFNLKKRTLSEIRSFLGYGADYLIKQALGDHVHLLDDALKFYIPYLEKHGENTTKPYEGISSLLNELKKDYRLAVVSNKHHEPVISLINKHFPNTFDVVIGAMTDIPKKPAPDMLLKTINLLDLRAIDVVYIGDSEVDIKTAKNANCEVIAVTWGFRDKEFLATLDPNHLVNHPKEILDILKGNTYGIN